MKACLHPRSTYLLQGLWQGTDNFAGFGEGTEYVRVVGRCRLTVSIPVLKALMVSALEASIRLTACTSCFQSKLAPLQRGGPAGGAARQRAVLGGGV